MQKRPIDRMRDAAISGEISSPDDPSKITDTIVIEDQLFIIKELGIYKMVLADEVDPGRINPNIAHTHQKVLSYGSNSPYVCRTLLTAKKMFDGHFLPEKFDTQGAMKASLNALEDLCAMADQVREFENGEAEAIKNFGDYALHKPMNMA